jgi:subtilisin family serine protease
LLREGDIILLEMHRPGPAASFQLNANQIGYIAVEWWPDMFAAIKYATNKGIIVIEAAGNGAQNLDDPVYNTPQKGFPPDWNNPFKRGSRDSGAILVGAGSPPPNTHGRTWTTDRARLDFSNYGSAVDAQGWGREVTSTGYGDLQSGDPNRLYTDQFSGTSSASPIVTGVVGCMQGVRRAKNLSPVTPSDVRNILRTTGSPQQDGSFGAAKQQIGNRPDLKQIIPTILGNIFNANDGVTTTSDKAVSV